MAEEKIEKKPRRGANKQEDKKPKKVSKEDENKKYINKEVHALLHGLLSLAFMFSIYFNNAGIVGERINEFSVGILGISAYTLPIIFFVYANMIFIKEPGFIKDRHKLEIMGIVIWSSVVAHVTNIFNNNDITPWGEGGFVGSFIGNIFQSLFGSLSIWILITMFIIFVVMTTGKSFIELIVYLSRMFAKKLSERKANRFEDTYEDKKKPKKEKVKKAVEEKQEPVEIMISDFSKKEEVKCEENQETEASEEEIEHIKDELSESINEEVKEYKYPGVDLLNEAPCDISEGSEELMRENAKKLEETLESFGVGAQVTHISRGPSVTRYELKPKTGIKVSKIVNLTDDIALNLAAKGVRIEAPIPGKAAIGIEVANENRQMVCLRQVFESDEFIKHPSKVAFGLGKDISGDTIVADIAKMPHVLIAGATGSGKSVCINTLVTSIIYKADPNEVKLIMIDPKVVELKVYNGIPHLMIPVVTDPKKAASALNWAVQEMIKRYNKFAENNVRDIKGFNAIVDTLEDEVKMPQLVIIIDELADLMMASPKDVEDAICRLAQMARAAGIHLVIATQRPSVDVITGVIKANIPSRIAFSVSSGTDSRTILDMNGAEKLLGKGDMLFYPVGSSKPVRIQGAFVSDSEVESIVEYVKDGAEAEYSEEMINQITSMKNGSDVESSGDVDEEYFYDAVKLVIEKDKASISMMQRAFRIGYNRAARLMDTLEAKGIVGPEDGSKPRNVLYTMEDYSNLINEE
ncbi:MAG: DNA translocase FtsK [Clostridia bacterium]|jgi:S-DNA-T family DNA segregation ATPase FtsK/SpoIIIE|nr:DNA translocase FtsK [Clostridia bacterium]